MAQQYLVADNGQAQLGVCAKGKPVWAYDFSGAPCCGARHARDADTSTPCQSRLRMRSGRCIKHGGKSKVGVDTPGFVDGSCSTKMPRHLQAAYQRILSDPTLLSLQKDIAVDEVRLEELGFQLESGFDSSLITKTILQAESLLDYMDGPGGEFIDAPDEFRTQLEDLLTSISEGHDTEYLWQSIRTTSSHKAGLIRLEQQMLRDAKNSISADEAKVLITAIVLCVQSEAQTFHARIYNLLHENRISEAQALLKSSILSQKVASRVQEITSNPEFILGESNAR